MPLSVSHLIAASRRTRLSPACSASAQFGENGLSRPYGLTILASKWLLLNAISNLVASCAVWSFGMLLLSSEYSSPPRPPWTLLSAWGIGGPGLCPIRRLLDRLGVLRGLLRGPRGELPHGHSLLHDDLVFAAVLVPQVGHFVSKLGYEC